MLDIDAVTEAIAAAITAAQINLHGKKVNAYDYNPDAILAPAFCVADWKLDPHQAFNGDTWWTVTCRLYADRAGDLSGQQQARKGVALVVAALEGTRNHSAGALGGLADDLVVRGVSGPRLYDISGVEFYGVEFTVFVLE